MPRLDDSTRDRLLTTAASLMWEKSYQATGVDELCQRANARKGSFYHFFPSKTDLAIAAIEQSWLNTQEQIFKPIFQSEASGLSQLRKLVKSVYKMQTALRDEQGVFLGCPFGNLGQEMALQEPRIRETLQRIFDEHCAYLEGALERAVQADDIPPGNNHQRAQTLFALLEGAALLAKVANQPSVFLKVLDSIELLATA